MKKIAIIIPCFNEEKSLPSLIREILQLPRDLTPIVVDDGSQDQTAFVAQKTGAIVLKLPANLGIGGAVQTGLIFAQRHHFDFAIQVDGDGQHDPSEIETLLKAQENSQADIVIGSRYLRSDESQNTFKSTISRRMGISAISMVIRWLYGLKILDTTSGFRLMNKKAMATFAEHYPVDFPEPITFAIAHEHQLKIFECPVKMRERQHGTSSITGLKPMKYMIRVIGYLILYQGRRK